MLALQEVWKSRARQMNWFAIAVIVLFTCASLQEFARGCPVKGFFYFLSAAINLNVIFMK